MKSYLIGAALVLVVLILAVGCADPQFGIAQTKQYLQAGDGGGPIPMCRPGAKCGPDDQLRQMAGDIVSMKVAPAYLFG